MDTNLPHPADALRHRAIYHPPGPDAVAAHQRVREATIAYGTKLLASCPSSPELDRALTQLTDSVMAAANAAIARHPEAIP